MLTIGMQLNLLCSLGFMTHEILSQLETSWQEQSQTTLPLAILTNFFIPYNFGGNLFLSLSPPPTHYNTDIVLFFTKKYYDGHN